MQNPCAIFCTKVIVVSIFVRITSVSLYWQWNSFVISIQIASLPVGSIRQGDSMGIPTNVHDCEEVAPLTIEVSLASEDEY